MRSDSAAKQKTSRPLPKRNLYNMLVKQTDRVSECTKMDVVDKLHNPLLKSHGSCIVTPSHEGAFKFLPFKHLWTFDYLKQQF